MANEVVTVTITRDTVGVEQSGFGIPLILACNTPVDFTERVRSYESLAGVEEDFATTTPEYLQAQAIFSQSPRPSLIKIGRLANKPTQRYKISVQTVVNSTVYKVKVNDLTASFTSDANATNDEIVAGLVSAINALAITTTASAVGSAGSQQVQLLGDSAGAFDSVDVRQINDNQNLLTILQDHADPGLAADLAAIADSDDVWFFPLFAWNSFACIDAISDYAEANKKAFVCQSSDTNILTLADGSDSVSIAKQLKTDAKTRTGLIYHNETKAFADAALVGKCAPLTPGSETWHLKTLAGVSAVTLTATHKTNARAKNATVYLTMGAQNVTQGGTVGSGEFLDVVRLLSFIEATIATRVSDALATDTKVPYTDAGIQVVRNEVQGVLAENEQAGGIAPGTIVVTVPKVASVSAQDKAARVLRNVKFSFTLAGAIHTADVSGVVSV